MNTQEMLSKIKTLLNAKGISLASATLENGTVLEAEEFASGKQVFIVTQDEKVPLPMGEYEMEDGKTLIVEEEGVISEVKATEEKEEEEKVEAEEVVVEDVPEEVKPEVQEIVEAVVEVIAPVIEEVKSEIEEMKRKYGEEVKDEEKKKEEMSAKRPARKPLKHSPENKPQRKLNKLSDNKIGSTLDIVMQKLTNKR
jgi:hypothetical protein